LGDEIRIGRRGSVNAEIVVHGKQGHSAYPQIADNPVPKLARIIDRLATAKLDEGTPDFQPSNLQVTVISVPNTATNVIPGQAIAKINIRYNDLWRRPTIEAWVHEQITRAAAEVGAKYDLSFSGTGDVFLTKPGPLVSTLKDAVHSVTGRVPKLTTGGGTSDARFIKDICPVVEFGLVNATIHQVDEHTSIADLEKLTEIYGRFIANYFRAE
jgi:succinyl-diaminopimelate desuccinylase